MAAAILAISAALVAYWVVTYPGVMQCDGSVPEWMIPADYRGSGCVMTRPAWEANLPWNAGKTEQVCLGMCGPGVTPYPGRQ